MSTMLPFAFEDRLVRVQDRGGNPWFVLADVCGVLHLANPRQVGTRLDDDEKGVITADTPGGPQEITIISESGLWSLVLTSRKPEAKRFKKWLTAEVIPAIRRSGEYRMGHTPATASLPDLETADGRQAMAVTLDFVRLALRVHGRLAAQRAWDAAGLPCLMPEQSEEELAGRHPDIAQWMDQRLEERKGAKVRSADLYRDYLQFIERGAGDPVSHTAFSRALSMSGLQSIKSSVIWWRNVALRENRSLAA